MTYFKNRFSEIEDMELRGHLLRKYSKYICKMVSRVPFGGFFIERYGNYHFYLFEGDILITKIWDNGFFQGGINCITDLDYEISKVFAKVAEESDYPW